MRDTRWMVGSCTECLRLFVNADGTPKSQSTVAWLMKTYLARRAGIFLTPHQFRHLSAKVLLDAEPGGFETVRQLLGHKNLKTTANSYAGIDSRRAARHHQRLIERALEAQREATSCTRPLHATCSVALRATNQSG
jgi:integrase